MKNTPVLLMLFNRVDTTQKVFESLRLAKPAKLFIAANGPRPDNPADIKSCEAVKSIFKNIDWPCEVHTRYPEVNIGMQRHWWTALDWFFENVESGIVLEDDCIPHVSFFDYCEDILERYKNDERIMHVNGSNFQYGIKRGNDSFYFSKYPHVWGWATWRRAWQKYDKEFSTFSQFEKSDKPDKLFNSKKEEKYWMNFFKQIYLKKHDGSDTKWLYTVWNWGPVCITPNVNMITNIGFGLSAGHTVVKERALGQESFDIGKITYPSEVLIDKEADNYTFNNNFYKNFFQKASYVLTMKIVKIINKLR